MKILSFLAKIPARFSKSDLQSEVTSALNEINTIVIPNYSVASDHFKITKPQSEEVKELTAKFYRSFPMQGMTRQPSIISEINRRLDSIRDNLVYIETLVDENFDKDILPSGVTAKKAMLLRTVANMSFINSYAIRLLDYIYGCEERMLDKTGETVTVSKPEAKWVEDNFSSFAVYLGDYSIPKKQFEKIIGDIPPVLLNSSSTNGLLASYKESELDPFTSTKANFTYSPFLFVGTLVAEYKVRKYKANKEKDKQLRLRLLHLQMLQEGRNDPKIQKEIEYIQDTRLVGLEKEILKFEKSLEG